MREFNEFVELLKRFNDQLASSPSRLNTDGMKKCLKDIHLNTDDMKKCLKDIQTQCNIIHSIYTLLATSSINREVKNKIGSLLKNWPNLLAEWNRFVRIVNGEE